MNRRISLVAAFVALAATAADSQQPPPPQTPTFKAQVEYVEVDALVTDAQGRFVRDLTKDDFQVFEDGRLQTISTFSLVDLPIERGERPLFAEAPIEPDVRSNERPFDGRVYVVILDDLHTDVLRSQQVKMAMRQFIERNLGENDLMAVVHTGGRSDAAQEFTNNRRLLIAAVDKFMGRKLQSATVARNDQYFRQLGAGVGGRVSDPYEQERAYNAQGTMRSLKEIAEWLSGLRGRRKTIIYVSEGIDYDVTDVIRSYDSPASSASALLQDIRETINAAARSNVAIYAIDPRGLTQLGDISIGVGSWADAQGTSGANPDQPAPDASGIGAGGLRNELMMSQMNLRALAEETNGYAAVNSNDFAGAFDRIVRDNSSYYVLAYYPPTNRRDGRFHRIQVRVSRPGVTVRARRGYIAQRGNSAPPRATPGAGSSIAVVEALNSPIAVSGLDLRVFAAPFKGTAPNASVVLGAELNGRELSPDSGAKVEFSFFAVDASGKTRGGRTEIVTLNLRPETRARMEETGLRLLSRVDLPPGRYTLRVATRDVTSGSIGSVSYDLEVPDFAKSPFSISGLALTSMSGSALVTVRPDEGLRAVLPAPPIALRTFPQNDEIALFAEVYERAGAPPHSIDIAAIVRSDEGTVVFKHEEERRSAELQGASGGYGYQARLPLSDLKPGLYVLTVEARSRLGEHPAAVRQVPFRVVESGRGGWDSPAAPRAQGASGPSAASGAQGGNMRVIDRGAQSRIDDARQVVARTAAEWSALWRQHAPDRPAPPVDFASEMVAGVFFGSQNSGGYAIEILGAAAKGGSLVVQYREIRPGPDAIAAQVITSPFHLAALPRADGDVKFERVP
jgi:VWFA-related protein